MDAPLGRVCAFDGCTPETISGTAAAGRTDSGSAGSAGASSSAGSRALEAHIEDSTQRIVDALMLPCGGGCVDVAGVASGGNPPYSFAWEDAATVAKRHVCLESSKQLELSVIDTPLTLPGSNSQARTASASLTVDVADCSDADAGVAPSACDHSSNLIANGSFEMPVTASGGSLSFATGEMFGGWTVSGAAGNVFILNGTFTVLPYSFTPHCGSQTVDLTGSSDTATSVEQTVATQAGKTYLLSFWIGNLVSPNGYLGTDSAIDVLVDGMRVLSARNDTGAGQSDLSWQRFSVSFTASSESTAIAFLNEDPLTDSSNILDDVMLE